MVKMETGFWLYKLLWLVFLADKLIVEAYHLSL
jgi:hypothetical protein